MRGLVALPLLLALVSAPASAKDSRQAFDGTYLTYESDNFLISWPARIALADDDARAVADALEASFVTFHDELGLPLPPGADTYRFNAYVSDAQGTPTVEGGGYMDFGLTPFLALHADLVRFDPGLPFVAAHEYFHAVQLATDAYTAAPTGDVHPADWWFEATATWAATQVFPDDEVPFGDLASYLAGPEHPLFLSSFQVAPTSSVAGHEYGAFLFPLHVSLVHGAQVVADTFLLAGAEQDPLLVLDELLPESSAADELAHFAARNAVWDYPAPVGDHLDAWLPELLASAPSSTVGAVTAGAADAAPVDERPLHAWGYHLLDVSPDDERATLVELFGDASGSAGTAGRWRGVLVVADEPPVYTPLSEEDGALRATIAADVDAPVFLAVANVSETRDVDETFGYRVAARARRDDDAPATPSAPPGCAASGTPSERPIPELAGLLLLVIAARPRPRRGPRAGRRRR